MNRNYQKELDRIIQKRGKTLPRLLLHGCCAPCSSSVLEYLTEYFDVTLLWYNPNIYPQEEFDRRFQALVKLIEDMGLAVPAPGSTPESPAFLEVRQDVSAKELFPNGHRVKFFIDEDLKMAERVSFHPCDNTASVIVSHEGFMKFLSLWAGEYEWIGIS